MSNYNSQLQSNNTDLQGVLELLQTKAAGENLDEEISTQEILISEQDAKIAELAEILSNKAGGGSNVETCTLQIQNGSGEAVKLAYTSIENNKIVAKYRSITNNSIVDILCLCGSMLILYAWANIQGDGLTHIGETSTSS